ncbi:hypothetical protein [Commensalibacter oyaizuii]|uniref:Uncharacterized protein n=1 Tax=Commensalibacter oyaizuii TaxID=3043873 RepID=A0ABT6Q2C4_9PROT|nr:hypothetical protein [Commensalibacter sp. TBRC 16381]MDI2091280.1 hypothetical protein [Commensalibacter sp. TBRC 16381]
MSVIPESEWQKKFNKTSSQDNSQTWQNRFKKPVWQQDTRTWSEKFNHSTKYVYKPINENYYIKQAAIIFVEKATWWAGSFF